VIDPIITELKANREPIRKDIAVAIRKTLRLTRSEQSDSRSELLNHYKDYTAKNEERYDSLLYTNDALAVPEVNPAYNSEETQNGHEILRDNFDAILGKYPNVVIFGEDSGKLGGVNQGLENMQAKYGEERVFDTGIREATIIGQAIGLALRGIRPIAEIQYLDYLLYAIQILSDDLATLAYRTKGTQRAPVII